MPRIVNCPACNSAADVEGIPAGTDAACPYCNATFAVKAVPPIILKPAAVRAPAIHQPMPAKKSKIHPAKRAMLIATILWPVLAFGGCLMGSAGEMGKATKVADRVYYYGGEWINQGEMLAICDRAGGQSAFNVTMLYGFTIVGFAVWWFATKPD